MKTNVLFLILLISAVGIAHAEEPKDIVLKMGTEVSHITYKEPGVMQEKGVFYGVFGNLTFKPEGAAYFLALDGHFNYGQVDYEGTGTLDNVDDFLIEPRMLGGWVFDFSESVHLSPYSGLGYRFLYDDLGSMYTSTGAAGYDRLSQYVYLPFGLSLDVSLTSKWQIGFNAEYDLFLRGWQESYLSDIAGFSDLKNTQDSGYGVRGQIDIKYKTDMFNILVSPYIRYWNIDDSDVATATYAGVVQFSGYEPHNTSTEIGAKLGVEF